MVDYVGSSHETTLRLDGPCDCHPKHNGPSNSQHRGKDPGRNLHFGVSCEPGTSGANMLVGMGSTTLVQWFHAGCEVGRLAVGM